MLRDPALAEDVEIRARSSGPGSAPERIRTSDLRFRRPTLYPAELRAQRRTSVAAERRPARGAERAGFDPAMELSAPYSLSRRVPSATRPPLPCRASVKPR